MTDESQLAPYFDQALLMMIVELEVQVEWAAEFGHALLTDLADPWSTPQSFAMRTALVGTFVKELTTRSKKLATGFPDRGEMLRKFFGINYDFSSAKAVRDGMVHIDERIEERWLALARDPDRPPALLLRTVGTVGESIHTMINWDPERRKLATAWKVGEGYDELDVAEAVDALERAAKELAAFRAWMEGRGPAPAGMAGRG
jgi:hypothetical protein